MKPVDFICLFVIVLIALTGCSESGSLLNRTLDESPQIAKLEMVDRYQVTVVDASLLRDTIVLPLSYFTEELRTVKLDSSRDDYFVYETSVTIGNQHILVHGNWDAPYKLFDKSGIFITDIGGFGQGPNEYRYIYDAQLDETNDRVYLLPYMDDKIFVYDLKGNNFDYIPLSFQTDLFNLFRVNPVDSMIAVFRVPVTNEEFPIPFCVWVQNMSGELIHGIPSVFHNVGINQRQAFHNRLFNRSNTTKLDIVFYGDTPVNDTLYHYDMINNKMAPRFSVDYGNRNIPIHRYLELPMHYLAYTYGLKEIIDPVAGRDFVIANIQNFIVDKTTLKGAYFKLINDFLGNIEIENPFEVFRNGYYVENHEPANLLEILENALINNKMSAELQKKVIDLKESIDANDNNYVFYAKLKQ